MKDKFLLLSFVAACLFASGWAFYLIGVHYDAVAGIEGGACGPEGGCQAVLQSGDAEIFGVPVSVPAVPLFAALAVLGLLLLQGKLDRERVASLATACGLAGQHSSQRCTHSRRRHRCRRLRPGMRNGSHGSLHQSNLRPSA